MNLAKEQLEVLLSVAVDKINELTEEIKDLNLTISLAGYEKDNLKKEIETLKAKLEEKEF